VAQDARYALPAMEELEWRRLFTVINPLSNPEGNATTDFTGGDAFHLKFSADTPKENEHPDNDTTLTYHNVSEVVGARNDGIAGHTDAGNECPFGEPHPSANDCGTPAFHGSSI
jgi:hypothetical protein